MSDSSGADGPEGSRSLRAWLARPALPPLPLASYRRERATELALPIAGALMEGGFVGVIADKVYAVHPAVLAVISAAPMFGNLSSFAWARLAHGRRKVPLLVLLQSLLVALVAAIALLPRDPAGAWLLVACMVGARLVLGGIVTVRSLVWTLNYARVSRARVTARLTLLTLGTITATSLAGGFFLDADPFGFRTVYGAGAVLASLGVLAFSGVRVLGEDAHLAEERAERAGGGDDERRRRPGPVALLRADPLFARYQLCQFGLGTANMMVEAPVVYLVSRELGAGYAASIALTVAIPFGVSMLTLLPWAAYIDRVHIAEFRSRHSWIWATSQFIVWIGALRGSLVWIGAGRALLGLARGGGSLAWQLGHNDFADPRHAGLYMGIHVTLTGVRGAFAPLLGMLLYVGWAPRELPGVMLPGFAGLGGHVMLLAACLSTAATLGFVALARRVRHGAV